MFTQAKTKTYQYIFSYKEHSRASHSSELPLLWGVFKGKQQIASKGEKRSITKKYMQCNAMFQIGFSPNTI